MDRTNDRCPSPSRPEPRRPDNAVLYSVDDIAHAARVSRVAVIRRCQAGRMPRWILVDGRRYWARNQILAAVQAATAPVRPPEREDAA
jgi:hypothetical protein